MTNAAQTQIGDRWHGRLRVNGSSPSATYRGLWLAGLSATEAGNVTAWLHGLPTAGRGWTVREIAHLQFIRHLVEAGRVPADD
ncbi:MAG: hypothetical protein ABJC39_12915 [Chloroflexota bacterium]